MNAARSGGSRHTVRRNTLWNVFGLGIPLVFALLFIPRLIAGMGADRFGMLSLILVFLNYFAFFDLGIGRALTQLLAERAGEDPEEEASLIWTVSGLLGILGTVCGAAFVLLAPPLVGLLRLPPSLVEETVLALRELGIAFPFLLHSLALRGVLESRRRFDLSNIVRIPAGIFTFGAPLLILPFTRNIAAIVAVVLAGRFMAWALNAGMILYLLPHVRRLPRWEVGKIWNIMGFGAWYTASNVLVPLIDGMDRFFVGRLLSVTMVAYYTTPYELIVRLGVISGSMGGAMFPEFASRLAESKESAAQLFRRGLKYLLSVLFPFVLVATAYAQEGLAWWLRNPEFAAHSAPVLRWFSIFVFITGASLVPLTLIQGAGRPDLSVRVHALEFIAHAGLLYAFIRMDGIRGAAIACVLRITLDFLGMLWYSGKLLGFRALNYARVVAPVALGMGTLLVFHIPFSPLPKACLTALTLALYAAAVWKLVLEERDKAAFRQLRGRLLGGSFP
jgi:O-antigen/teichoic acid export membrane protein